MKRMRRGLALLLALLLAASALPAALAAEETVETQEVQTEDTAGAQEAGVDLSVLSWMGFLQNMIPVTVGNIIGGCGFGALIWATQRTTK